MAEQQPPIIEEQKATNVKPKEANSIRTVEKKDVVYELSSKKMVKIGYWAE